MLNAYSELENPINLMEMRKLKSAIDSFNQAIIKFPEYTQYLYYNLGVLYRSFTGNGVKARKYFLDALDIKFNSLSNSVSDEITANSLENLILLSVSKREYEDYVNKFNQFKIKRNYKIDSHSLDDYKNLVKEHSSKDWSMVMQIQAFSYFRVTLNETIGKFAEPMGILQLIFENLDSYALDIPDYTGLMSTYSGLTLSLLIDHEKFMESNTGMVEYEEFDFINKEAIPYLEKYMKEDFADEQIKKNLDILKSTVR